MTDCFAEQISGLVEENLDITGANLEPISNPRFPVSTVSTQEIRDFGSLSNVDHESKRETEDIVQEDNFEPDFEIPSNLSLPPTMQMHKVIAFFSLKRNSPSLPPFR